MVARYFIAFFLCACLPAVAQQPLSEGWEHFYNLEYEEAIAAFTRQTVEQPNSPDGFNHLAQSVLYRDMFRAGALESELVTGNNPFLRRPKVNASPEDQRRFDQAIQRAIDLARQSMARNSKNVQALYSIGVSYGLRANYNFLVRKAWRDSLSDATTARKYHNQVSEIDPAFVDARLTQGIHDYIVGSLPLGWRLLGFLIGFHGNKEQGIRTVEMVARQGVINRYDAKILLCAAYRRENKPSAAVPVLRELIGRFPRNYLLRFELSQMYSLLGDKANALAPLDEMDTLVRRGAPGYGRLAPEKILFARGTIQFWYRDFDQALLNLGKVAAKSEELDLNTGVMAWLRVGQLHDLKGQRPQAVQAYRRVIALAPNSDAAGEARKYLSSPYHRRKR